MTKAIVSVLAVVAGLLATGAVLAEPYQISAGDRVLLKYAAQGTAEELSVDIDGQLRVVGVGGVSVEGLSLDAAEKRIDELIVADGTFLNPNVSLQILEYAPVIVSGDVARPGQYAYFPGMTVNAAIALAGGSQVVGVSRFEVERARIDNEGQLQTINLEIAGDVLRIARLEALLSGAEIFAVDEALLRRIPSAASLPLDRLTEAERAQFENARAFMLEGIAAWESEVATLENQLQLFEQRLALQEEILATTARELKTAEDLRDRGLQTAQRFSTAEQRDADARSRALELDSTRIAAVQALAEARRSRFAFERSRREEWLAALQATRLSLETSELGYGRRVRQQALLTGSDAGSIVLSELITRDVTITSRRAGREMREKAGMDTVILPGDLVIMTVSNEASQGQ